MYEKIVVYLWPTEYNRASDIIILSVYDKTAYIVFILLFTASVIIREAGERLSLIFSDSDICLF